MKYLILILLLTGCAGWPPIIIALEQDKILHTSAGVAAGTFGWEAGCVAGLAKEGYDKYYGGTVEFADFAYTCAGSGLTHYLGKDKSWLYRADVSLILLDGLSTSHAIHNGAQEVGWAASRIIGTHPSDNQIAAYTASHLGLLHWSESWHPTIRKAFQWAIFITRPYIVISNFKF